jgi:hypothetical protein
MGSNRSSLDQLAILFNGFSSFQTLVTRVLLYGHELLDDSSRCSSACYRDCLCSGNETGFAVSRGQIGFSKLTVFGSKLRYFLFVLFSKV